MRLINNGVFSLLALFFGLLAMAAPTRGQEEEAERSISKWNKGGVCSNYTAVDQEEGCLEPQGKKPCNKCAVPPVEPVKTSATGVIGLTKHSGDLALDVNCTIWYIIQRSYSMFTLVYKFM